MPLSRQTSRIVWPSKPSTTRPSTSMRMRGVDCGRCGDWVSSSRSASDSASSASLVVGIPAGVPSGRARVSVIGRPRSRPAGSAGGVEARTRSIASRWSAGGWPGARGRTAPTRRCRAARSAGQLRVGRVGAGRPRAGRRSRPGASCRCGTGWSCRTPRSSRSGSARRRARRRSVRSSTTTIEPEPTMGAGRAQRREVVRRVERVGRQQPARRAADEHRLQRPARRQPAAEADDVAQRRPERDLGDAVACRRPRPGRGPCPGGRSCRSPRNASAPSRTIHGTAASVWTLLTTVGHAEQAALGRDAAAAARAGRACPRAP